MNTQERKTILVSPLEWGLGHTVRVVPVVEQLLGTGHRVILASGGNSLRFLRYRFPEQEFFEMPFHPVRYSGKGRFFAALLPQIPGILRSIRRNRKIVANLVKDKGIDLIISDHRYGIDVRGIPSVFITNQLWLKAPAGLAWGEPLVYRLHLWILKGFTEIWIPDFPGSPNISGIQTHPPFLPDKVKFLGPLSRFSGVQPEAPPEQQYPGTLAILSGPEPQRSILEEMLVNHFTQTNTTALILRGIPPKDPSDTPSSTQSGCVRLLDHASDAHIHWYMNQAERIICRPGNSTITDLIILGKSAILVPTPGQTEQEYVARHLENQGWFERCDQKNLSAYLRS
jgi:predicted glycosyltransferase